VHAVSPLLTTFNLILARKTMRFPISEQPKPNNKNSQAMNDTVCMMVTTNNDNRSNNNYPPQRSSILLFGKVIVVAILFSLLQVLSTTRTFSRSNNASAVSSSSSSSSSSLSLSSELLLSKQLSYLMIVAHPDDEALWAGEFLAAHGSETHVVVTSGKSKNQVIRRQEFEEVANVMVGNE
jgi:hypothetical protein